METLHVVTREAWREWLETHHATSKEIWLVYYKKHTGKPRVAYDDAVEEALCFGWIDSIVRRLDDDRYAQKFTPRSPKSVWSESNKERVEKVLREGRMTPVGMALVEAARASGEWDLSRQRSTPEFLDLPEELLTGLETDPLAKIAFEALPPSHRRNYALWIGSAKRTQTRQKRTLEVLEKLARGEPLGMK